MGPAFETLQEKDEGDDDDDGDVESCGGRSFGGNESCGVCTTSCASCTAADGANACVCVRPRKDGDGLGDGDGAREDSDE